MTNVLPGLLFDQTRRSRVRPGGAACIGGAGCSVRSAGTRRGAPHRNALCRECRRLTMRGDWRLMVRLARSLAQASSSPANQRSRLRGRSGEKGP